MRHIQIVMLVALMTLSALALGQTPAKKDGSVIEQLKQLDRAWLKAEKNDDVSYCEKFFAPSYVLVRASGKMYTKDEWLAVLRSPNRPHYDVLSNDDIQVHLFGTVAILTDDVTAKGHDSKGQSFGGQYRAFRVMIKQNGRWRATGVVLNPLQSK
ncbi:MAG TPA: nuclear transport factor 2 family protein [Terriglobia bacterium]|nr:nuclear transport factor 2 family protein [Terriglobia bacterium]